VDLAADRRNELPIQRRDETLDEAAERAVGDAGRPEVNAIETVVEYIGGKEDASHRFTRKPERLTYLA